MISGTRDPHTDRIKFFRFCIVDIVAKLLTPGTDGSGKKRVFY